MNSLIVQKYGGSSLATVENLKSAAMNISQLHKKGHPLIIVVSAMGQSTDQLTHLAYQLSSTPHRRELDMLLSTGERVSMALMSMALHDLGCSSISFTGSQAGVFTDGTHSHAKIIDIKPVRIEQALKENKIIVLAGFQGVNPETKEITTLGRGGSDTTAVAMAIHFKAHRCEMHKDVDGVCSADPHLVKNTQTWPEITFSALCEICFWGSSILHYRAIALAKKTGIPLFLGHSQKQQQKTSIQSEVSMYESEKILSVNTHGQVEHLQVSSNSLNEGLIEFHKFIVDAHLPTPQVLTSIYDQGQTRLMITGSNEVLTALQKTLPQNKKIKDLNNTLSSVTVTCHEAVPSHLTERVLTTLSQQQIEPEKLLSSPLSLTVFVKQSLKEKTIQALHKLITN